MGLLICPSPPVAPVETRGGLKYSTRSASDPSYAARTPSIIGAGPSGLALAIALAAGVALIRYKVGVIKVIAACALVGLAVRLSGLG